MSKTAVSRLEERRLSEGLAAEKLDQDGHSIIRDYDGIS